MKEELAPATAANVSGQSSAPIDATAQFLTFEPGMYAVDLRASLSARTNVGLSLPSVRLDPVAATTDLGGRAFISMVSDGGWLSHGDVPAFIRVVGGRAGVLLTIYKSNGGMPSPELRIRYIRDDLDFQPTSAPQPEAETSSSAPADTLKLPLLVHIQQRGDIQAEAGEWAGTPGSQLMLEGFAVAADPEAGIDPTQLEYQGILGDNWSTPWFPAGEFCGSRGMALPMLGFRVRLTGRAAETHDCVYSGSFIGRGEVGPIGDGQACEAGGQPLDAMRVSILPKATAVSDNEPDDRGTRAAPPEQNERISKK